MFYRLDEYANGYVDCVKVTPCSDAGAEDNRYWIESGCVNLQPLDEAKAMQEYSLPELPDAESLRHMRVDYSANYYGVEVSESLVLQIGPDQESRESVAADRKVRAGTDLAKYVVRNFLVR